eukprot:scaffold2452_cov194-Amphora_coffeaeformis.AAC.4
MKDRLSKVLELSGVQAKRDHEALVHQFEAWLGLDDDNDYKMALDYNGLTLEDCTPLPTAVYQEMAAALAEAWKPTTEGDSSTSLETTTTTAAAVVSWKRNLLLESEISPDVIQLQDVWDSIRATRYARILIDLHVGEDGSSQSTTTMTTTSQIFMQTPDLCTFLVPALYHHITTLPLLQSQIHQYKQTLQQRPNNGKRANVKSSNIDPKERLAAYERAQSILDRLLGEWQDHTDRLTDICIAWYRESHVAGRLLARQCLGRVWADYIYKAESGIGGSSGGGGVRQENTQAAGIHITLRTLDKILSGMGANPLLESHERLLFHHLVPLHKPNGLVLWRDQTPILQLYHEALTRCCALVLRRHTAWIPRTIQALLQKEIFPPAGNTGKQVLLLHEMDTYLGLLASAKDREEERSAALIEQHKNGGGGDWFMELVQTLSRCMASEHSAVAERALQYSKSKVFQHLVKEKGRAAYQVLLPALVRKEPSWNPTVRKMTYLALKTLQDNDNATFAAVCNRCFGNTRMVRAGDTNTKSRAPKPASRSPPVSSPRVIPNASAAPPRLAGSFPSSMPPPPSFPKKHSSRGGLPLTTKPGKGAAPWSAASGTNPPLTITGVAPWAVQQQQPPTSAPWATQQQQPPTSQLNKRRLGQQQNQLGALPEKDKKVTEEQPSTGFDRVVAYMEKLKPADDQGGDGTPSWSKEQMAETPTLLPDLKFHDLVFGHDLGEGAFGSVRYARLIDRSKTRSNWSEFAVKVISTEKIQEFGYEYSIGREIAVLRMLSHPSVARLVSSFRFREGAYLVLEYASGGDLHDFLRKKGSLDEESTRFVIGEVMAGLQSIHDLGLVHIDLKAENILITEIGHIKLTDFGGCRPVTKEAKERVSQAARNALRSLRNGDWKVQSAFGTKAATSETVESMDENANENDMETDEQDEEDDYRLEGTTANLPPEIVLGGIPSFSTDSWALGCVMYQCLTGRPPLLDADESATKQKIVQFASSSEDKPGESNSDYDELFGAAHASGMSQAARGLIRSLLERDTGSRPSIAEAAMHEFFKDVDVFALYQQAPYPLDVGTNAPSTTDSKWSRRQFSTIWAPQPAAYDLSPSSGTHDHIQSSSQLFSSPIPEGEEAGGHFTPIRTNEGVSGPAFIGQKLPSTTRS